MIDFGQVGHSEALEDMLRLGAVLRVVEDDVQHRAAGRHLSVEVVHEGVFQTLLVARPARDGREGRVEARMTFEQFGDRAMDLVLPCHRLPGHQRGPEVDDEDQVIERFAQ